MLSKLKKSEYLKNSFTLIFGTALVQVIPFLLQPILRRIYSDEDFGNFAIYYSIVSVLSVAANLRYANSIVIPKKNKEAISLLTGALILNLLFSIVTFIILLSAGTPIFDYFNVKGFLRSNFWVIPLGVFLISSNLTFNFWLTRMKKFRGIVLNKGARRISEGSAQLVFSSLFKKSGLLIGSLVGDFVNLIIFFFQFKKSEGTFKGVTSPEVKSALKEQIEFPKYSFLPSFLNILSTHIPVLIVSAMYAKSLVGQFDGSRQMLALPLALISASISQVLYQKLVELINQNKPVANIVWTNFLVLFGMATIGTIVVYFFGVELYTIFLGGDYRMAGEMSQILIFSYAIRFIVSPLSMIFMATKKLKLSAIWQVIYFTIICSLFLIDKCSIEEMIYYIVTIDIISYLIYAVFILYTVKQTDKTVTLPPNKNN